MIEIAFAAAVGIALGALLCWLVLGAQARAQAAENREEIARLNGRLAETQSAEAIIATASERLGVEFKAAASEALNSNKDTFLALANENLGGTMKEARDAFEKQSLAFQNVVKPLSDNYGKLGPQIETLGRQINTVTAETTRLSGALTDNQRAGAWGEIQLRRVVELAGMLEHCDFEKQQTLSDGFGRPDMVITLPNSRKLVVDAKASTAAYMEASESTDEAVQADVYGRHAHALKSQVDSLAKKNYGAGVDGSLDFVVMFVPGDQFLAAALKSNPGLIEYGMQRSVAIATPVSLISLLWTVANGWQQDRIAREAKQILESGLELHKRLQTFVSHYSRVGVGIERAMAAYNDSIGSYDRNLFAQGERFTKLLVGENADFETMEPLDLTLRESRRALPQDMEDESD